MSGETALACVIAVLAWVVLGGCTQRKEPVSLTVAAGAGLSEVMRAVGVDFERVCA